MSRDERKSSKGNRHRQQLDTDHVTVIYLRFLKETKTYLCVRHKKVRQVVLTYFKYKYTGLYTASSHWTLALT